MREHPRPIERVKDAKGYQLHNIVNSWKHRMMNPKQKALDKSLRRRDEKKSK